MEYLEHMVTVEEVHYEVKKLAIQTIIYSMEDTQNMFLYLVHEAVENIKLIEEECKKVDCPHKHINRQRLENSLSLLLTGLNDMGLRCTTPHVHHKKLILSRIKAGTEWNASDASNHYFLNDGHFRKLGPTSTSTRG